MFIRRTETNGLDEMRSEQKIRSGRVRLD